MFNPQFNTILGSFRSMAFCSALSVILDSLTFLLCLFNHQPPYHRTNFSCFFLFLVCLTPVLDDFKFAPFRLSYSCLITNPQFCSFLSVSYLNPRFRFFLFLSYLIFTPDDFKFAAFLSLVVVSFPTPRYVHSCQLVA